MAEQYRIQRIEDNLSNLNPGQIGVEPSAHSVLGVPAYGGKDYGGEVSAWAVLGLPSSFSTLQLTGPSTTGALGILKHDATGNVTGGQMTIEEINNYISDGPIGPAHWDRDGDDNYLFPIETDDTLIVGDGDVSGPAVAYKNGTATGHYYDNSLSRLRLAMGGVDSWQYDLLEDVHRILVGTDQGSPNQRYFQIKWEEEDYESRSVALIENYRGSGAPGTEGTFTISNNVQDGSFSSMTVKNFHPGSSFLYLQATGSASTLIDINSGGAVSEIKNTANKITMYGQVQANPADDAAAPEYSFIGATGSGMRYETSDSSLRFGLGGKDLLRMVDTAGISTAIHSDFGQRYFGIYHDLSTGTERPELSIVVNGTGTAVGSHMTLQASSVSDAGTPSLIDISATGGYSYVYIDSTASGDFKNAETRLGATAGGASAIANIFGRSDSSNSGHAGTLNLFAENRGAGKAQVWIGTDNHLGSGTGEIYIGTNGSYFTNKVYFTDANRTGSTWVDWGPLLSSNGVTSWNNYRTRFGEVGLMDAVYSAGGQGGTLDTCYDFGGAGAGRVVTADSGPVRFVVPGGTSDIAFQIENLESTNTSETMQIYNAAALSTGYAMYIQGAQGGDGDDADEFGHWIFSPGSLTIGHGEGTGDAIRRSYTTYQYNDASAVPWARAEMRAEADTAYGQYARIEALAGNYGAVAAQLNLDSTAYISVFAQISMDFATTTGGIDFTSGAGIHFDDTNRSGWTQTYCTFSDSGGWAAYKAIFGEVGLMNAIAVAGSIGRIVAEGSGETANSTSSGTYQQRIRVTTPSLTSGVGYLIIWSQELQAQADCEVQSRLQLNDTTTIAEPYYDNDPYATRGTCQSGIYYSDTLSGVYNIDMDWRKAYDPGSGALVYCGRARIVVIQITE